MIGAPATAVDTSTCMWKVQGVTEPCLDCKTERAILESSVQQKKLPSCLHKHALLTVVLLPYPLKAAHQHSLAKGLTLTG